MNENLTNVAWKCKSCGEVTYHPSADRNAKILIRERTLCLKCLSEGKDADRSSVLTPG